ncbi:RagB/SusD family nutrient uptake outer membrane protein [Parapedobacter soli]|uniref:RagB/SusD family nutrient uptake outer membrane protein n=1 Tax=Parapedobacter soli TaxID=416955 RepID=UPI0021C78368|nr:RagB/SusD family nutrient uptake outer membrane protein [Parapedobacter soli]
MKIFHKRQAIYLSFILPIFLSCNNNLDEVVYSELTTENYSITNAYQVIGIVYANMRPLFWHQNYYMLQETSADAIVMPANAAGWDDGGIYRQFHLHTWNSETPQLTQMWNTLYTGVINTNRIIEQLEAGAVPDPERVTTQSLVAEMKTARAFFYWLLMDNFGEVPLLTAFSDELPAKSTRREIYNFVTQELEANIPLLSELNNPLYYGRFNRWAGKALLANIYLNAKVYVGEEKWQEAIRECDDIINSGNYSIANDVSEPFRTFNENSPEIIFAIPFDEVRATGFPGGFCVHLWSWHAALRAKFNMIGIPWATGSGKGITQFINTYVDGDKRLQGSWMIGPQFASDGVTPLVGNYDLAGKQIVFTKELPNGVFTGEAEGYRMNKFQVKSGAMNGLDNDFPFFRYAQILMIKAECLLRLGLSDEAAVLVNEVRRRAFQSDHPNGELTGEDLLKNSAYQYGYVENYEIVENGDQSPIQFGKLYDELGFEFSWEGHRRRDMIRFGIFTTKSWLSHKPNGEHRICFPIPQIAVNTNPNLVQHSSYQ